MTRARNTADELSLITAKGDLLAGSASGVQSKLTVGSNNTVLTADSSTATGLKWGSVAATKNFSLLGTGTLTGATTVTVSSISGQDQLFLRIVGASAGASANFYIRFNADTGSNYDMARLYLIGNSTYSVSVISTDSETAASRLMIGNLSNNAGSSMNGYVNVFGGNTAGKKIVNFATGATNFGGSTQGGAAGGGVWNNTSTITSVSMVSDSGNFDAGTFEVYGSA